MPEPALVQSGEIQNTSVPTSGTTFNVSLTGVTAGNTIVATGWDNNSGVWTFDSDNDGAPDATGRSTDASSFETAHAAYWFDVAGGTTEISAIAAATATGTMVVSEVSNTDEVDVSFVVLDWTDITTADLAGTGTVPVAANSICFKIWVSSSASVTVTPDTDYVALSTFQRGFMYYKTNSSEISDENAQISNNPTTRDGPSLFFSLREASAGGVAPISLTLKGVG